MSTHHRVTLPAATLVGEPCAVPDFLVGLEQISLDDLSWADPALGFAGQGLWPLEITEPTYDTATEMLTGELIDLVPVKGRKVVKAKRGKRDLTPDEIEARRPPPHILSKMQFIRLVQTAGGMTDALLAEADANPLLTPFWIKFRMSEEMQRDDMDTQAGLGALEALGLLPNGASAVIAAWPAP